MGTNTAEGQFSAGVEISEEDIYEAMKDIPGYLDITPGDFKEVFRLAYRHAVERITRSVKARNVMTREVFSVGRETPLGETAALMAKKGISGVPVLDKEGHVVGVISEKDFLSRMGAKATKTFMDVVAECLKGEGCLAISVMAEKAEDIMTAPAITVSEEVTVLEIANIFTQKKINRVPVTDAHGRLLGIVSREDIVRAALMHGHAQ